MIRIPQIGSSTAKRLYDSFLGQRRSGIRSKLGSFLVRPRQNLRQFLERREVAALYRSSDHRFDAMIARYDARIDQAHERGVLASRLRFARRPRAPSLRPYSKSRRFGKQPLECCVSRLALRGRAQPAERQRKVGMRSVHDVEQSANQFEITVFFRE